jgi:hypothetical protein
MKDALFGVAISRLEAMREKARFVLGAMEMRMAALGFVRDNVMALLGAIRAWNCSAANCGSGSGQSYSS